MKKWLQALTRRTKGEKGVTLIELLAVIVIIAVIAAIAVPVVLSSINKSKTNTAKQDMAVIAEALNRYAADNNGQYPKSADQTGWDDSLASGSKLVAALSPAYLQNIPKDSWGNDFYYWSDGNNFELETAAAHDGSTGDKLYLSNKMSAPDTTVQGVSNPDSSHTW